MTVNTTRTALLLASLVAPIAIAAQPAHTRKFYVRAEVGLAKSQATSDVAVKVKNRSVVPSLAFGVEVHPRIAIEAEVMQTRFKVSDEMTSLIKVRKGESTALSMNVVVNARVKEKLALLAGGGLLLSQHSFSDPITTDGDVVSEVSMSPVRRYGWQAAIGTEYRLNSNCVLGARLKFVNFGTVAVPRVTGITHSLKLRSIVGGVFVKFEI